jgi:predicted ATPase
MPVLETLGRHGRSPAGAAVKSVLHTYALTWLIQLAALVSPEEHAALQLHVFGVMQERMLRELVEALDVLIMDNPLILVLEDLHWADASTLALVSVLARRPEPARLLVLGTYRPSEARRKGARLQLLAQELAVHGHRHELAVPFFDETTIAAYMEARFPQSLLSTRLAQTLHHRSGGNPLFMIHIVQD